MTPAPELSLRETAGVLGDVVAPLVAQGVIVRRPRVLELLDRLDADRRAVRRLQRLRRAHGDGVVRLRIPLRDIAVVLASDDVGRVLESAPDPFSPANREKRTALGHFQPDGVLVSTGGDRVDRRRFNEAALETERPVHSLADPFTATLDAAAAEMLAASWLTWDAFARAWWRAVRTITFGASARDEEAVTELLTRLRKDANWAFLKPRRTRLRAALHDRIDRHLARAEPGSLAAAAAAAPSSARTRPADQVSHWLFAFDAAGMATFRTLALLDAHPAVRDAAREQPDLVRASVLEAVRLWPTTPAILRDTTSPATLTGRTLEAGTGLLLFAPYFHRDDERLPFADRFAPEQWVDGDAGEWPLVPFSAGPGECPARNLVLFLTASLLARLLDGHRLAAPPETALDAAAPLPATLSPFRLRFRRFDDGPTGTTGA